MREEVSRFAELMEAELQKRDAVKGYHGWRGLHPVEILDLATPHHDTLEDMLFGRPWISEPEVIEEADREEVRHRAVAIANYMMMVADRCGVLSKQIVIPVNEEATGEDKTN